ncbi:MAG: M3 family peptidase, partial [Pseudomonadota bacterium]|nr:M3 family peptidase [Pseudomonadota bacterium]
MGKFKTSLTAMAVVIALGACSEQKAPETTGADTQTATTSEQAQFDNVLLQEFKGPYDGVPAFDKMKLEDLKPALEKAMALNLEEIEAIANNEAPPTFENVIVEMERAGAELGRVFTYYGIWSANKSSPEFREIQAEMSPKLSAFFTQI